VIDRYEPFKAAAGWLPQSKKKQVDWVNRLINIVDNANRALTAAGNAGVYRHAEVKELDDLINGDPIIRLLTEQMIQQAFEYDEKDPCGKPEITSYGQMLRLIDAIMNTSPEYMSPDEEGRGLIGFPINAVLDWCMGTQAGYAFFLEKRVNERFEKILKKWCEFLCSENSAYILNDSENGWLCESALGELNMGQYICDPTAQHYGFRSWNDFFTRKFKEGERPVECPDDPYVIVSACESAPYKISKDVQEDAKFWLKGQPYSLEYMLNKDADYKEFIGGTIYQAFLSATRYHRWHSPVDGVVKRCYTVPGTYYAELNSYPYDDAGPNNSQGYITHIAARAIAILESDNPDIGLMGFVAVGMSEVSSCIFTVKDGQHVKKGDELGYFQFGGSTHCLIFRKDVIDMFVEDAIPAEDFNNSTIVKLSAKLATAKKKKS
jgi:phosphatidylserine decarboxylase